MESACHPSEQHFRCSGVTNEWTQCDAKVFFLDWFCHSHWPQSQWASATARGITIDDFKEHVRSGRCCGILRGDNRFYDKAIGDSAYGYCWDHRDQRLPWGDIPNHLDLSDGFEKSDKPGTHSALKESMIEIRCWLEHRIHEQNERDIRMKKEERRKEEERMKREEEEKIKRRKAMREFFDKQEVEFCFYQEKRAAEEKEKKRQEEKEHRRREREEREEKARREQEKAKREKKQRREDEERHKTKANNQSSGRQPKYASKLSSRRGVWDSPQSALLHYRLKAADYDATKHFDEKTPASFSSARWPVLLDPHSLDPSTVTTRDVKEFLELIPVDERKSLMKSTLKRFHPDKAEQKGVYSAQSIPDEDERESMMTGYRIVTQALIDILKDLE